MAPAKTIELLAPAKNLICGRAAIGQGADAVYIGGPMFGAREDAGNSIQDIEKLVSEAQIFGVKVYVALNTILFDNELEEASRQIWKLYEAGVDALIIQDLGILEMDLPPLPLHASTQLHNYLPDQLRFLEAVHFKRAVLARELNLDQIREIRSQTSIELEAFIHGALCVSFSGRCYLSYAIGGRSANRGACAQPCRKRYTLYDSEKKMITADQHLLSLKDLNHSHSIGDLVEAGVQSLKIEGRLKDVDYVKNITAHYRQKIDAYLENKPEFKAASAGKILHDFEANPVKSFNRGSTSYFLYERSKEITSFASPKFLGEELGLVTDVSQNYFEIKSAIKVANNDGLVFISQSGESIGIKVNIAEGARIFPDRMNGIFRGALVYRNYDHLFHQQLNADHSSRKITVNIEIRQSDNGFELTARDETGIAVSMNWATFKNPAHDMDKSRETIINQLSKAGCTNYTIEGVETNGCEKYFFQSSVLNSWRRSLLDQVTETRTKKTPYLDLNIPNNYPYPSTHIGHEGNISNRLARQFFRRHGVENPEMAFEKLSDHHNRIVMTTNYCLKFQLGFCPKFGGTKPWNFSEPFYLNDGKNELKLDFDCARCEMKVIY